MNDCWDCIHLEKRTGGFQYCLLYGGRRNVDANKSRCDDWTPDQLDTRALTGALCGL